MTVTNLDRYEPIHSVSKKYLFGLIKYTRLTTDGFSYCFRAFGLPIVSRQFDRGLPVVHILFFKFRLNSAQRTQRLLKDIAKQGQYDNVFVLFNNLGETRLFLECFRSEIPCNSIFVYTKPYHRELLDMIIPQVKSMFYPEYFSVHFQSDAKALYIKKSRVNLIGRICYFKEYEAAIQAQDVEEVPHFYRNYLDKVGRSIGYTVEPKTIMPLKVSKQERKRALEKLDLLIGNNKFVIICNETFSNINLKPTFYQELCRKLYALGYKVLFNSTGINCSNTLGITASMSIQELVEIASRAEFVIGIRSGILDVLASNAKAIVALYTPFRKRPGFDEIPAEKVLVAFSLAKIDFYNKPLIREIIVDDATLTDDVIKKMLQCE